MSKIMSNEENSIYFGNRKMYRGHRLANSCCHIIFDSGFMFIILLPSLELPTSSMGKEMLL